MKLITKALTDKIPAIGEQDGKGGDAVVYLKLFHPLSKWKWYVTEYDKNTGECFGFVDGDYPELGYFHLSELKKINICGLGIERDTSFQPTTLKELGFIK